MERQGKLETIPPECDGQPGTLIARMSRLALLAVAALALLQPAHAIPAGEDYPYRSFFQEAYRLNPSVPRGVLEAVAQASTRMNHLQPAVEDHHHGKPTRYGVMGLVRDGKGVFRNTLREVAALSGYGEDAIAADPRTHILAYAKAYAALLAKSGESRNLPFHPARHLAILQALSELPGGNAMEEFARDSHLYQVMDILASEGDRKRFGAPDYRMDLKEVFGPDRYAVLSSPRVFAHPNRVAGSKGGAYTLRKQAGSASQADPEAASAHCDDYPDALWAPAKADNYGSRKGTAISAITIHTMQGSYAGSIAWFQNSSSDVSVHYLIRARDGQITQAVCESDAAWHARSANSYAVGIEHEGYIEQDGWYTDLVYRTSAALTLDIARRRKIDPATCYKGAGTKGILVVGDKYRIKGHQHFSGQTHTDPGPKWDWVKYYGLLNPTTVLAPMSRRRGKSLGLEGYLPEEFAGAIYRADGTKVLRIDDSGSDPAVRAARPAVILYAIPAE
jgi:N-acetyl-anhydromuramyl-L-alanine amidase AmpD